MEKYDLILSPTAQRDFMGIVEQINTLPPEEANLYIEQILTKAEVLLTEPESCHYAKDSQLKLRGYRVLTVEDRLFFFIINGNNSHRQNRSRGTLPCWTRFYHRIGNCATLRR